jgi:hypothetical protein
LDRFRNGRRRSRVYSLQACLGQEGNEVVGIDKAVVVKMFKKALLAVRYHFQSNDVRPTGRRSKLSEAARAECKRDLAS